MLLGLLLMFLAALPGAVDDAPRDVIQPLLDTIDSLQEPIEDFRCEFEGTVHHRGRVYANSAKTGPDGLYESYSGLLIWKRGGDLYMDCLHQEAFEGAITRETLVIRWGEHKAERYLRRNDAELGAASVVKPEDVLSFMGFPIYLFSMEYLGDVRTAWDEFALSDDTVEGRKLKILSCGARAVPGDTAQRLWIDLHRNGNVVRHETYTKEKKCFSRIEVKLAPFKLGNAEVWMPVSGVDKSYWDDGGVSDLNKLRVVGTPTVVGEIRVVGGSMEFNQHPGREVFTIKYKAGTRISDALRRLEYEYGRQTIASRPTKAEAESMLDNQLAQAEDQKAGLMVAPPSADFDWTTWLAWGFGGAALISLIALLVQKSRR